MQRILNHFCGYLTVERGLSKNTVSAYRSDLNDFVDFLGEQGLTDFEVIDRNHIIAYFSSQKKLG